MTIQEGMLDLKNAVAKGLAPSLHDLDIEVDGEVWVCEDINVFGPGITFDLGYDGDDLLRQGHVRRVVLRVVEVTQVQG